jgi:hypothetical protein
MYEQTTTATSTTTAATAATTNPTSARTEVAGGRPAIVPPPFDLYRDIHKAIRVNLFEVTAAAGRTDPDDRAARIELAARVRDLVDFLRFHAEHEDRVLDGPIAEILPDLAAAIGADHVSLESEMEQLVRIAERVFGADEPDARVSTHELYLELAAFTSSYLAHQDTEERIVGPALFAHFGFEPLLEMHGRILAAISPEQMGWSLSKMVPAMNVADRTEMFAGMRMSAPPEAFEAMLGLAADVLTESDFTDLDRRLDAIEDAGVPS